MVTACVSLIAAFSCLVMSVTFAALYAKVSRRKADLLFALLSLCLALTLWGVFMEWLIMSGSAMSRQGANPREVIFWWRMKYVSVLFAPLFFHFVSEVLEAPVRHIVLVLGYLVGAVFVSFGWTDLVLRMPPRVGEVPTQGPLMPLGIPLFVLMGAGCWKPGTRFPTQATGRI